MRPQSRRLYERMSDRRWVASLNLGWEGERREKEFVYGKAREEGRSQHAQFEHQRDGRPAVLTDSRIVAAGSAGRKPATIRFNPTVLVV